MKTNLKKIILVGAVFSALAFSYFQPTKTAMAIDTTETGGNAYTIVDMTKISYARIHGTPENLDCNASPIEILNTPYEIKTVVGFNTPDVDFTQILRVTITVYWYEYRFLDFFHLSPISKSDTYTLKNSSENPDVCDKCGVLGRKTTGTPWKNVYIPYVGTMAEWTQAETETGYSFFPESIKANANLTESYQPFSETDLASKSFYLITPNANDWQRVWISIAGTTANDEYIGDGLDIDGNPFEDETGQTFIQMDNSTTANAIHFNGLTTITDIVTEITPIAGETSPQIIARLGNYDFKLKSFSTLTKTWILTANGAIDAGNMQALEGYELVLTFIGSSGTVKIFFTAENPPTLANITDTSDQQEPIDTTPQWNDTWLEQLKTLFSNILNGLLVTLKLAIWVAILALATIYVFIPLWKKHIAPKLKKKSK